ncbi:hypothetical protein RhiJN_12725 [Ceratobasidium sp. AG-Ba]|nr:hypothetical protein RhiJN_12725 [Ceratobasidium sp. AG-Ba]
MTHWHFNLRSGYESDDEEGLGDKKAEPVPSAEDELHNLFGTNEETVVHKPNPWKIAKMNADTRRTAKGIYYSPENGSNKRHSEPKPRPNSLSTKPPHSIHLKIPFQLLCAAYQRFRPRAAMQRKEMCRYPTNSHRIQVTGLRKLFALTIDHEHFTEQREHNDQHYNSTNISSRNAMTSPTKDLFALQVHHTGCETHEEHTPPLTWAHPSSDDFVSPIKSPRPLLGHHKRTEESWEHTSLFDVHSSSGDSLRIPLSPEPTHSTPTFTGWSPNYVYANMETPRKPEPQHIVDTPQDLSHAHIEIPHATGQEDYLETLALSYTPVSTRNALKPNSIHAPTTQAKQDRNVPTRPGKEDSVPSLRYGPFTPPRQASRSLAQSHPWSDPDEEPVWSTLPARPKKTKQVKTPVISSPFRLPRSFLGSSPLGEKQPKRLYKPPPRKRSREQDEASETRWKVTRLA